MTPRISIIVPIYNEERTIATVVQKLHEIFPTDAEMIFVDDGSKDASLAILRREARPMDLVLTKENGGKGSAVRLGITKASAPYTVIQDADLEYDPVEIRTLLAEAGRHPGEIIFGSRFLRELPTENSSQRHKIIRITPPHTYERYLLGNRVITGILNVLFGGHLTDSYTCYKLFPTHILKDLPLQARGFELEAELSAWPLKRSLTIHEVPISYRPRSIEEGKKIRAKDAWKGLLTMLRIRFTFSSGTKTRY